MRDAKDSEAMLPLLSELGPDLLLVGRPRIVLSLMLPFLWCGIYFAFSARGWWVAAVFALVALSFVTYGSVSHDLVHRNLGLKRWINDLLLCLIELLALRSGHAYQAAHLRHHARFPSADDVEARAARMSCVGALVEGIFFHGRIWVWALRTSRCKRRWIIAEGVMCVLLGALAVTTFAVTPIFTVYAMLMVVGSWVTPLLTAYVPHDPAAEGELRQTRAFRGAVASAIALGHLYHLEHHLYPCVPHQRWPELARRLDPFLAKVGVKPVRLWF